MAEATNKTPSGFYTVDPRKQTHRQKPSGHSGDERVPEFGEWLPKIVKNDINTQNFLPQHCDPMYREM